ncbi:MAG: hypothetical protein C6H99_00535 [Epsilonproteobacteria bacterium]|nr:hypothetical protein [Campylobacterota bacterium]NPA63739.1 hypothetical protein [Campylobacterota bacterium]
MRILIIITLFISILFGAAKELSPLPLPKTYFINLDIYPCDRFCLKEHLENEEYLSFMAKMQRKYLEDFKEEYQRLASLLNAHSLLLATQFRIAILYPKRLKKYANKAFKALSAYLLQKDLHFEISSQSFGDKADLFDLLDQDSRDLTILLISYNESKLLEDLPISTPLFVPTLYKYYTNVDSPSIYFGGIDYPAQAKALKAISNDPKALFYLKNSYLSTKITQEFNQSTPVRLYAVDNSVRNLANYFKNSKSLDGYTTIYNTPLVKTALILSQMRLYKIKPAQKLSTQINYNPKLFHLTQPKDRSGLLIATNFGHIPSLLYAQALAFDEDLAFEWIGYSSCIGMENLLDLPKLFQEIFVDNQVRYETNIKQIKAYSIEEYQILPSQEF